jgi:hydroxymethylglutaryl-CoA synthase
MMGLKSPGVSGMSAYLPRYRVQLRDWCEWTGNSWEKIQGVVGRSFRMPSRHENAYTMAANAVLRLIRQYDIDPQAVGFLGLGTESSTDNAVGAVIVRGLVDRGLSALGLPTLSRNCEVPEFKHACLGGVYALKAAVRYVACEAEQRAAIVVCADVAEYERGSTGEQTQGAGAVAMLVTQTPSLFTIDLRHAGSASAYRGPDFRKPFARHFHEAFASGSLRLTDFPVFSGKYSTYCYLDETACAVDDMLRRLGVSSSQFYRDVQCLFFHRPYEMMPIQALSYLLVRSLATEDPEGRLDTLCRLANVSADAVREEVISRPDLFARAESTGALVQDPSPATTAVSSVLRKDAGFRKLVEAKMSLGADAMRNLGNLYSAAMPAWIAAGFEEAASRGLDLNGKAMVAVGYGSGDAAEAIPIAAVEGWEASAARIGIESALGDAIDLTREQYEALHDGRDAAGLVYEPRDEFIIDRIGSTYQAAFQDLGIEYYRYVR